MRKVKSVVILFFIMAVLFVPLSATSAAEKKQAEIDVLVLSSRRFARMEPETFYALKDTAKQIEPSLNMKFVLFNPLKYEIIGETPKYYSKLKKFHDLLIECVPEVVAIKRANPKTDKLLNNIHTYIKRNPEAYLAKLHKRIDQLMEDFQFLIVDPRCTYGVHSIFFKPGVTRINTADGATAEDIMVTLYGFFFLDAAFRQDKPVWGSCYGAQLGYVHAGGKLGRLFEYKKDGYDVSFKKKSQKPGGEEEIWYIDRWLYTHKKGTYYYEYGIVAYPVPEVFKASEEQDEKMYINKDFEHYLAMVEPIPDEIKLISYHPMSEYKDSGVGKEYQEFNKAFKKVFKNQVIVGAYKYKTMLGTQYHPQFTYDDLETSIIFKYLIGQVINKQEKLK